MMRERKAAKDSLARLAAEKDARAHEAARAKARMSKRHLDPKDRSAKAMIDLARYTGQDGARGKLSAQMDARLASARERVAKARVEKRYDGDLWLDARPSPRKTLARIEPAEIPCGEGALALPRLFVGNTDHIGIKGPDGAGKTTLLEHAARASGSGAHAPRYPAGARCGAACGGPRTRRRPLRCRARSGPVHRARS